MPQYRRREKVRKGPNPLSVKRSKKHKGEGEVKETGNDGELTTKKKRKRRHKKSGDRSGLVEQVAGSGGGVDEAVEETKHTDESVNVDTAKDESNSTGASPPMTNEGNEVGGKIRMVTKKYKG